MELMYKVIATSNLYQTEIKLSDWLDDTINNHPEKEELIKDLETMVGMLKESRELFVRLDLEHTDLVRKNHALYIDNLNQEKEIKRLKEIEKNINL